ncbi:tetratricopeptide repeat protein 31 isoform X2 [Nematolebias whitei]|nr:tetratricopeptide repeat protein 31 isoform X2 [Nematolebias whitei]
MFESRRFHRILSYGLLGFEYDEEQDVDDRDSWSHQRNSFYGYQDGRGLSRNHSRSSSSIYQPSLSYSSAHSSPGSPSLKVQPKESDIERKARLLQEAKKSKEKAEKKRLKKQKQKQRKQMEKEKLNKEGNAAEEDKSVNDPENNEPNSSEKNSAAAKDTDSDCNCSEYESSYEEEDTKNDSGDEEGLDLTSTFVSKAALIARRKLEQKGKKSPEKSKSVLDPEELALKEAQKKDSVAPASLSIEDNVKISTDLAIMGNKFASSGDYSMAVKYFTDAIKYNPKEFKLFGNRSFCFEKLQECEKALADAELSLGICPGWIKGLFRKGRALAGLKRYEEAADAFRDVLKRESSYAEAAQELMRVQIIQLMECGFTREQSSNALIIHGTVKKALEVLSKLHPQPGAVITDALPPARATSITGVSPVLSAGTLPSPVAAQSHKIPEKQLVKEPTQNISSIKSNYTQATKIDYNPPPLELFPVWVGNLTFPLTESTITNLFSKVGVVYSVKVLAYKRCAFVNFTKPEHCDEAIRRFHGSMLNGVRMAVKYPDRIPAGMGMSRSALRSQDLQEHDLRSNANWRRAVEDPSSD